MDFIWLRNISKARMAMIEMGYGINVWKKTFIERFYEYGRNSFGMNERE